MARLVVAHVDADREVGREGHEPSVLLVIRGAGLAGDRLADLAHGRAGAALDHAFHHRGDLVGGHRVEHLLAPVDQRRLRLVAPLVGVAAAAFALVVTEDGVTVAVLDAVDQRRLDLPAAVVEHGISTDHAKQRRFACAERKREVGRQVVVDAEALGVFADQRHADVLSEAHRHHVARLLDPETQRRWSVVFAGIVFRRPDARAGIDLDRRVQDDRRRRIAVIERRGVDEWLEGGARLAQRLGGAVELTLVV